MSNEKRLSMGWLLAIPFLLIVVGVALADEDQAKRLFLPVAVGGVPAAPPAPSCDIPNTNYQKIGVHDPMDVDPETDPDLNLGYRGYKQVNAPLQLVTYAGKAPDTKAPQLPGMFANNRVPTFTSTHQRYRWNYECDCPLDTYSKWPATVLGMKTTPGEVIYTPESGYNIGGGYEYIVMYAAPTRVTLHIGIEDDFAGYVVHVEDVCVDSDLLALYRQLDAAGRGELPALRGHQAFGRAIGGEIKVAMRDSGSYMDPRSRNDWWQGR